MKKLIILLILAISLGPARWERCLDFPRRRSIRLRPCMP